MSYATVIQVGQFVHCFHTAVFFWMIEPTRTDRNVTLGCHPLITVSMAILQFAIVGITGINFSGTEERPVGGSGKSFLVSDPTATGSPIGENNCLRLQFVNHFIGSRIVVICFAVDST